MSGPNRKSLVIGIAFVLIASACAAPATPPPSPSPLAVAQAFEAGFNQHAVDTTAALFAENPVWNLVFAVSSQKAVHNILEFETQLNAQWKFSNCTAAGDTVTCQALWTDDCVPPELTGYHSEVTLEITGGKITRFAGPGTPAESQAYDQYNAQRLKWAATNLPEDHARYVDAAEWLKFNGAGDQPADKSTAVDFGQAVDRICKGYAAATK